MPVTQVPLLDLRAQYAALRAEILPAIERVLESQQLINGPEVAELEEAIRGYCGSAAAVGVSSGTDALLCALTALDIGHPAPRRERQIDEVITSPYTFFATAGSIWRVGARPVFVDIDPATFNIDASRIEAAITPRTRAIIPVHLFGQTADMDPILAVAAKHRLPVIEDAAQALGAAYKGRKAGSLGTVGCFSFFPSKNLGGAGDGGIVTAQEPRIGERLAVLRSHGAHPKHHHRFVGGNFRLDTIQAAYLMIKLAHLDGWSARRRANAAMYDELLTGIEEVRTPAVAPHNLSIYNQYVLRAERRDELRRHLSAHGIGSEVYYPLGLHEQECFRDLGYRRGDFPHCERAAAEALAIPIYPELGSEQIRYVADTIRGFYAGAAPAA